MKLALPQNIAISRPHKLHVGVVCGGDGAEAEVSRVSGQMVANALAATFPRVSIIEPTLALVDAVRVDQVDVVFPALHGPIGEDGCIQGMLEVAKVPYVGSGVLASACGIHKVVAKRLFRSLGLPVAPDVVIDAGQAMPEALARIREALGQHVVVKPVTEGSAIGVTFGETDSEIQSALDRAFDFSTSALVEARVVGSEVTVGVLETPGPTSFPPIEVRTPPGSWYDFEHRYTPGQSEHVIPAPLPPAVVDLVQRLAAAAHTGLGCRDLSRADFVVTDDGRPFLLELNTLPGMTPTSLYPDGARAVGVCFEELVVYLVGRALTRSLDPASV